MKLLLGVVSSLLVFSSSYLLADDFRMRERAHSIACEHRDDQWCAFEACENAKRHGLRVCMAQNLYYVEHSRDASLKKPFYGSHTGRCQVIYQCLSAAPNFEE